MRTQTQNSNILVQHTYQTRPNPTSKSTNIDEYIQQNEQQQNNLKRNANKTASSSEGSSTALNSDSPNTSPSRSALKPSQSQVKRLSGLFQAPNPQPPAGGKSIASLVPKSSGIPGFVSKVPNIPTNESTKQSTTKLTMPSSTETNICTSTPSTSSTSAINRLSYPNNINSLKNPASSVSTNNLNFQSRLSQPGKLVLGSNTQSTAPSLAISTNKTNTNANTVSTELASLKQSRLLLAKKLITPVASQQQPTSGTISSTSLSVSIKSINSSSELINNIQKTSQPGVGSDSKNNTSKNSNSQVGINLILI